jgi:hypothetical protein
MANHKQSDLSAGMISANVSICPSNSVSLLLNMDCDNEIGSAVSRLGTATIDAQLVVGVPVLGLVQHCDQADSTKNKLFVAIDDAVSATNSDIWDLDGSPAVSLADDTKNLKCYFLNYNGDTLRLNGNVTDGCKAYNSTSWITTGGVFDLANMPTGYKYPKEFLDRVYLWGNATTPYRLYYSGILTVGVVSWTSGQGYVDIEPEDNGGEATGLGKVPGYILIFKRRSMHRWNYSSAFPEALVNIGAYSQTSIVEGGGLCAFYSDSNENEKGFYVSNGGRPVCISKNNNRPIKKWVDAISATAVVAGWATESVFAWSVSNLVVDGETFNNVVLRYNRILNQWSVRTYPQAFTCFTFYVLSGVNTIIGGADDGTVYRIDKSGTFKDAKTTTTINIPWRCRTHHWNFGENREKVLNEKVIVRGKNLDTARTCVYANENITTPIFMKNNIWNKVLSFFGISQEVKGNTIAVEVSGQSSGAYCIIREIELPSIFLNDTYV